MATCLRITEWIVREEEEKLSFKRNLQLISHLAVCTVCRRFAQQNALINQALFESRNRALHVLTAQEKEALVDSIRNRFAP